MELKELLPNNRHCYTLLYLILLCICSSCGNLTPAVLNYQVDTSFIPHDTVLIGNKRLMIANGVYLLNHKKFSGIVKERYAGGGIKSYASVCQGLLHGRYKSFYENGHPFEVRMYKNNLSTGRHYGYWPQGHHLKFDYNYFEEKREGLQKKWYPDGKPYLFANYTNDHEEGLQQGWRENGKLFLNYVVKDGFAYGLQQTALCYSLRNQKIRLQYK